MQTLQNYPWLTQGSWHHWQLLGPRVHGLRIAQPGSVFKQQTNRMASADELLLRDGRFRTESVVDSQLATELGQQDVLERVQDEERTIRPAAAGPNGGAPGRKVSANVGDAAPRWRIDAPEEASE